MDHRNNDFFGQLCACFLSWVFAILFPISRSSMFRYNRFVHYFLTAFSYDTECGIIFQIGRQGKRGWRLFFVIFILLEKTSIASGGVLAGEIQSMSRTTVYVTRKRWSRFVNTPVT